MDAPDAAAAGASGVSARAGARPRVDVILIIEHRLFRQGIRVLLDREPERYRVIAESAFSRRAIDELASFEPDVVLIDLTAPSDGDRADVITLLKSVFPKARIIVITAAEPGFDVVRLVRAGANGYLTHSSGIEDVLGAIDATSIGGSWIDPRLTPVLMEEYRKLAWSDRLHQHYGDQLSARDRTYLELLASGLSNRQISDHTGLAESTVKNNLSTLFRKINVRDRTQAVLFAIERGIVSAGGNHHE